MGRNGRPYAVVVGGGVNALGVARSLAREDVPVAVLDTDGNAPAMRTRFAESILVTALDGSGLIEELLRLRPRFAATPVLFLTQEAGVAAVSAGRAALDGIYGITMPAHETMRTLTDKTLFQARAEALGFAVPKAIAITADADLERLEALRFPAILKPARKEPRYEHRFSKAYRVADPGMVRELWRQMAEAIDRVIVQEWIDGGDSDVYFCLQYRRAAQDSTASFTGRKTCQWPPLVGGTATCIPAPEAHGELSDTTSRFFEAAGFAGLGSMEYKRDRRDGRFYMVEPTVGRTDYQEEIATLNGINIPYAAWLGEQGREAARIAQPAMRRAWRDSFGWRKALAAGATDAIETIAPGLAIADAHFRFDDPLPYLAERLAPRLRAAMGTI